MSQSMNCISRILNCFPCRAPSPTSTTSHTKTITERLIETIDPAPISGYQSKAFYLTLAAKTTLIASAMISLIGIGCTAIFAAPVFLFAAIPAGILTLIIGGYFYAKIRSYAEGFQHQADHLRQIDGYRHSLNDLPTIQRTLSDYGINWALIPGMLPNPNNLTTLKPLISFGLLWMKDKIQEAENDKTEIQKKIQEHDELLKKIGTFLGTPFFGNYHAELEKQVLEADERIASWKLSQSYFAAAILKPTEIRGMNDLGRYDKIQTATSLSDTTPIFTFNNTSLPPITWGEVKTQTLTQLNQRMLAAMNV